MVVGGKMADGMEHERRLPRGISQFVAPVVGLKRRYAGSLFAALPGWRYFGVRTGFKDSLR
eukprot:9634221-Prorocentrum_lima.AAC.1